MSFFGWRGLPKRLSLRTHLTLLVLVSIVPGIVFTYLSFRSLVAANVDISNRRLQEISRAISFAVDREITSHQSIAESIASYPEWDISEYSGLCAMYERIRRIAARHNTVITILDINGQMRLHSLHTCGTDLPIITLDVVDQTVEAKGPRVSDLFNGPVSGRLITSVMVPVVRDSRAIAIVTVRLEPKRLAHILEAQRLREGTYAVLLDGSRRVIARSTDQEAFLGQQADFPPSTQPDVVQHRTDTRGRSIVFDTDLIPSTGQWTVSVIEPEDQYASGVGIPTATILFGVGFAMLACTVGGGIISRRILAVTRDVTTITEQSRDTAQRMFGLISSTQSILRLTPYRRKEDYIEAVERRFDALVRSVRILVASNWNDGPIRDIIKGEVMPSVRRYEDDRISVDGEDFSVPSFMVQPLCIIMHEMISNASMHGALSEEIGHVSVTWERRKDGLLVVWKEIGGPQVDLPIVSGFGMRLIKAMVARMHGTAEWIWDEDGLVFSMMLSYEQPHSTLVATDA